MSIIGLVVYKVCVEKREKNWEKSNKSYFYNKVIFLFNEKKIVNIFISIKINYKANINILWQICKNVKKGKIWVHFVCDVFCNKRRERERLREINNERERKGEGGREGEEGRRDVDISGTIQRHNREQELCTGITPTMAPLENQNYWNIFKVPLY